MDPIWGNNERNIDKKISIFGGFINDENLINKINKKTLKNKIDLVISSHTFEHTDNKRSLQKILKIVDDKCLFIIETPSLDSIIRNGHFDQYSININIMSQKDQLLNFARDLNVN